MPAKDLGTKHTCFKCGTRFYDLKKPTPICPKCGADQRESPAVKAPVSERKARRAPAPVAAPVAPEAEVETEEELEEELPEDEEAEVEAEEDV